MEGLAAGRDMSMYLLHDPIEDNPNFGWDDYRKNYYEVVTASLLCPGSDKFEVCPWPNRIINNKYPAGAEDATYIPADYRALARSFRRSATYRPPRTTRSCASASSWTIPRCSTAGSRTPR